MNVITSKTHHDSSFSFSRRYFHWKNNTDDDDDDEISTTITTTHSSFKPYHHRQTSKKSHHHYNSISKLKSALSFSLFSNPSRFLRRQTRPLIGTIFGRRRGHVRLAFQAKPNSKPCFLIELATPTCLLIREMASGLVRITLECEKKENTAALTAELLAEPRWRAYCNGRKCGYASNKRECVIIGDDGDEEWKVLKAVEAITMGAGVLPAAAEGNEAGGSDGEVMYMRAKFERVVGSTDSEAFYMMNPDQLGGRNNNSNSSGPELSIYLLRV